MSGNQYCYKYPRPMVTVDIAVFGLVNSELSVILINRGGDPYRGFWALPGGFVDMDEPLADAANRELLEETGIEVSSLYQAFAVGTPGRDPRGRTISVIYSGFVTEPVDLKGGSDADDARWFAISNLPDLAFDHSDVLSAVLIKWGRIFKQQSYNGNIVCEFWEEFVKFATINEPKQSFESFI